MDLRKEYKEFILSLQSKGPEKKHYDKLYGFFGAFQRIRAQNPAGDRQLKEVRSWFGESMNTTETLQGHVCIKPHGYDGDYEIIDKIYTRHISGKEHLFRWDEFFHTGVAAQAVRNRKEMFIQLLENMEENSEVLNLASGPSRDIAEFYGISGRRIHFTNIELDPKAIAYSKKLLEKGRNGNVQFVNTNILRYAPDKTYDLIWSAGLFDYFDDVVFVRLLRRLVKFVKPKGSIIIGNFSPANTSRAYMEFGNWFLHYRDHNKLLELCKDFSQYSPEIIAEPLGVNLFLKLTAK